MKLVPKEILITLASTSATPLSATLVKSRSILIQLPAANTGNTQLGDASVSANSFTMAKGSTTSLDCIAKQGPEASINLADVYVKGTSGDKIIVLYLAEVYE